MHFAVSTFLYICISKVDNMKEKLKKLNSILSSDPYDTILSGIAVLIGIGVIGFLMCIPR